jgi:hypothetical protein
MKYFDLNIDKILENWELPHAVREIIANAIDESVLTRTEFPSVFKCTHGWWHIRDYGRGLCYQDLIQRENNEKLAHPAAIGKFGIGLKDALATFERKSVIVLIRSRHGDMRLTRVPKGAFSDMVSLHVELSAASFPAMIGTDVCLSNLSDADVEVAKMMFLSFAGNAPIEETKFGSVYSRTGAGGVIYINGLRVAAEPNFLFSYNITSVNASIKRALNRERQNLGRTAYAERIRAILLSCSSEDVAKALALDLQRYSSGTVHDELTWLEVQEHAVRVLNSQSRVLFVSAENVVNQPSLVDSAKSSGLEIVTIPEILTKRISGITDLSGNTVTEINYFLKQYKESFSYVWVAPEDLTPAECCVWEKVGRILDFIGGRPEVVSDIRISENLVCVSGACGGVWLPDKRWIVIARSQLASLSSFAGTLLHEALHAKYAVDDVSRQFETHLTLLAGDLAACILSEDR